jgi:DNA-binding MarR family transcriptional regulator
MLEINLKQLEAFVATTEFSSFTKAAEALYLTQSTVSAHINAMEQVMGVRLIQRGSRRRVQLTPEGKQAYDMAKEILNRCQTLQNLGSNIEQCQLSVGASSVPSQYLVPELMSVVPGMVPGQGCQVLDPNFPVWWLRARNVSGIMQPGRHLWRFAKVRALVFCQKEQQTGKVYRIRST